MFDYFGCQLPPTRAKSPKLGRRKSCSDAVSFSQGDKGKESRSRGNRQSLGSHNKDQISIQNVNASCKFKDESEQMRETDESISPNTSGLVSGNVDIVVQSRVSGEFSNLKEGMSPLVLLSPF